MAVKVKFDAEFISRRMDAHSRWQDRQQHLLMKEVVAFSRRHIETALYPDSRHNRLDAQSNRKGKA